MLDGSARKKTQENGTGDGIDIGEILSFAAVSDVKAIDLVGSKLGQEFAQFFAQNEVWADLFIRFGVEIRKIDCVTHLARQKVASDNLGNLYAAFFLRFEGAGAEMRGQANARMFSKGVVGGQGFRGIYVQGGGGYFARIQCGEQIGVDDNFSAGTIDNTDLRFHSGKGAGIEHAAGLVCYGHMHGKEVCRSIDLIEIFGQLNSQIASAGLGEKRIVTYDLHAKSESASGDFATDTAKSQDAQSLACELNSLELFTIPLALGHGSAGLRHFSSEAKEHGKGELGR